LLPRGQILVAQQVERGVVDSLEVGCDVCVTDFDE
jgi:hypothetical protein